MNFETKSSHEHVTEFGVCHNRSFRPFHIPPHFSTKNQDMYDDTIDSSLLKFPVPCRLPTRS